MYIEIFLQMDVDDYVMDRDGVDEYSVVNTDHREIGNSDIYKLQYNDDAEDMVMRPLMIMVIYLIH